MLIGEMSREHDGDLSLASLARRSGWSACHLQRSFKRFSTETPKQFSQRIRLERAAGDLLSSNASILTIALDAGFGSHEVFSRSFRRRFGCSPQEYRASRQSELGMTGRNGKIVYSVSPCVRLYRVSLTPSRENGKMADPIIEKKMLESKQPILFVQRRIAFSELQQTMGECFGTLYGHGAKSGLAIAGQPIARYVSTGPGLWTVDFIMPLASPAEAEGEMQAGVLPSGPVAFAVHQGAYDTLGETNAAIEKWIEENGYSVSGAPWESYVTDPGETPDPANWKTEIFWPLKA